MKKPNYCKAVVIVHGKSELMLVQHIKSNLRLPIEIHSRKNGKSSIQIDGLLKELNNTIFKNKQEFTKINSVEATTLQGRFD